MLANKNVLITGVVDTASIAYAIARQCLDYGAEVILAAPPRDMDRCKAVATGLHLDLDVVELDATNPDHWTNATRTIGTRWQYLDGAVHAIAYAPATALHGTMLDAEPDGLTLAFQTSVASYAWLGRLLNTLAPPTGGSLVGLDFDASRAWPTYNWMGVCKAALEATNQYLARDLAATRTRSNLIAAGPVTTRAASGIPGFDLLLDAWEHQAPLAWDPNDPTPIADAACFLLSDLSRATTGEILHVDAGFHAMATVRPPTPSTPTSSV